MKRLLQFTLLLAALAWCAPAHATWTLVQHVQRTTSCSSPCSITVGSTGSGNLLVGVGFFPTTGATMTSISGGTSAHHAGCAGSRTNEAADAAYVLSATGGSTSITFTASTTLNSAEFLEYAGSGPFAFDNCNNSAPTGANAAGTSVGTITGTNDVIIQYGFFSGNQPTAGPNSCGQPFDVPNGNGVCGLINTTNTAAGNWTNTSPNNIAEGAIAFSDTSASSAPSPRQMLTGVGD